MSLNCLSQKWGPVQTDPAQPSFRFQFRAVDKGLESLIKAERPDVALSLIAEMGAQYCPWCGQNLAQWYGEKIDRLYRPGLAIGEIGERSEGKRETGI
jgi:hypothetical protein